MGYKNLTTPFATNYLSLPVPTYDANGNQTNKESMKVAEKNTLNLVDTKEVVNPKDYTHYFKSDELSKEGVKVLSNALTNGVGENGSTELKLKNYKHGTNLINIIIDLVGIQKLSCSIRLLRSL